MFLHTADVNSSPRKPKTKVSKEVYSALDKTIAEPINDDMYCVLFIYIKCWTRKLQRISA